MILFLKILAGAVAYLFLACIVGRRLRSRSVSVEEAHAMATSPASLEQAGPVGSLRVAGVLDCSAG